MCLRRRPIHTGRPQVDPRAGRSHYGHGGQTCSRPQRRQSHRCRRPSKVQAFNKLHQRLPCNWLPTSGPPTARPKFAVMDKQPERWGEINYYQLLFKTSKRQHKIARWVLNLTAPSLQLPSLPSVCLRVCLCTHTPFQI